MPLPIVAGMAIGAGINAVGGIFSSWLQSRAIEKARKEQAAAAQRVGQAALDTSEQNAQDIYAAGERGATDVTAAGQRAGEGMWVTTREIDALLDRIYGENMAALEPYQATGRDAIRTLQAATGPGGDFNRPFTGADLENEPGYQFRLAEGAKALERSAAARGTLLGGRGLKEMERFSQGYASDEFGKAFERFRTDRSDRYNQLYNLANVGLRSTETGIGVGETYGGRRAGLDTSAARYEGDMNYAATQDAGNFRMKGIGAAGDYRMKGLDIWGNVTTDAANTNAAATLATPWPNTLSNIGRTAWDLSYLNALPRYPWNPPPPGPVQGPTPPGTPSSVMTPQQAEDWWRITHPTGIP